MKLGVTEHMDCAHHLPDHAKCGRQHGHTYRVDVVIEGKHDGGMMLDFAILKQNIREVLAQYDHRDLNDFLPYPSVENICVLLKEQLQKKIKFPFTLRVWEGEGKWAEL